MDRRAVTTYRQLLDAIAVLAAPAPGTVRVFRGQPKDYGSVLSSFGRIRRGQPRDSFDVFMRHLFVKSGLLLIVGDLLALHRVGSIDIAVSVADFVLAESLVQHYGYQSRYVDVTPSIEVALWFALHQFEGHGDTPADATTPPWLVFPAWYAPVTQPGVLYVMDVTPWNRVSSVRHGEFIDLVSIAPQGVNRPRRQAGGVLYAPAYGPADGDVSGLVRGTFDIGFPWTEVGPDWDTDFLFPGPREDVIYETLLNAPFFQTVRQLNPSSEEVVFRRTFSLPEYSSAQNDIARREEYRRYRRRLQPTLYYPWLQRNLDHLQAPPAWDANFQSSLEKSVPIMLQRPNMLFSMHRGGPPAPPASPPNVAKSPFQNFFLEFSPENFSVAFDENRMHRGVWCVLFGNTYALTSFGARDGHPWGSEIRVYEWQPGTGLTQTLGSRVTGDYVTFPLNLIRLTAEGALKLDPPGNIGHGYYELTTTDRFWAALPQWTDLM
jgi:hypothetical protein